MKPSRLLPLAGLLLSIASCTGSGRSGQDAGAVLYALARHLGLTPSPTALVDLGEMQVTRIGPGTEDVDGIYFSDFVEKDNSNHIRRASAFRNSADTLLGDSRMPLSHFSRFYGIERGRIKAGRLDQFDDSTTVLPVRNRDCGYISRFELERDPQSRGWTYIRNPFTILKERRIMKRELIPLVEQGEAPPECLKASWIRSQLPIVTYYPPATAVKVFAASGPEIDEPTVRDAENGKIFLADSLGNAVFINNLPAFSPDMLEKLNRLLSAHPMGPVLIDNGRYRKFSLSGGNYADYTGQDLYRPDSCLFVVGSVRQAKSGYSRSQER